MRVLRKGTSAFAGQMAAEMLRKLSICSIRAVEIFVKGLKTQRATVRLRITKG